MRGAVEINKLEAYLADDNAQKDEVVELCCKVDERGRRNAHPEAAIAVTERCVSDR